MTRIRPAVFFALLPVLSLCYDNALAANIVVKGKPVDHAVVDVGGISKDQHILVKLFDTEGANLGSAKHRDTANLLAHVTPHLLAVDIVQVLRSNGFTGITLDESGAQVADNPLVLDGRFTVLNPGSQAVRAWIGFGAGKSKVCVKGYLTDKSEKRIAEFTDCSSGLGWGKSEGQIGKNTDHIGHRIANLLIIWSEGRLK